MEEVLYNVINSPGNQLGDAYSQWLARENYLVLLTTTKLSFGELRAESFTVLLDEYRKFTDQFLSLISTMRTG